ncbi:MAG: four helix bundle protein [Chitinophagaceae bacterium]|nr:four helix bundle protein [Chitinophagaceae bacterium]
MDYTLETLEVYKLSEELSDQVWKIVIKWDYFHRDTIGKQLTRAADSVGANIAEGYGRYFFRESKQFYFYARASLLETKTWITKCMRRNIAEQKQWPDLLRKTELIHQKLNAYIKFVSHSATHNPK